MKAKTKIGKKKKEVKRLFPVAKRGGILSILPLYGVLSSLVGCGAAGIAKDNKAAHQLKELKRYNRVIENHGVYLALYKRRRGISKKKSQRDAKNAKERNYQHTNVQPWQLAKRMYIPYFRKVFMHTTLLIGGVHRNKNSIINLDNEVLIDQVFIGWHMWKGKIYIFYSFGNFWSPKKLVRYLENNMTQIEYNRMPCQRYDVKTIVDSYVCSFYRQLTINLKTDITLFKLIFI